MSDIVKRVSFLPLDNSGMWQCAAPRHVYGHLPDALWLVMISSRDDDGELTIVQANYCCANCRARMEAGL